MNYRNRISPNIPSLESIFVESLKADINYREPTKIPSNRQTIYYLLFKQEMLPANPDEKKILQYSILKDSFLEKLYAIDLTDEKQYNEPLLYYIIHRNEPFPTNSKYSQFLSNMFQKNFTGKGQPPQVRTILNAIDIHKLSEYIDSMIQRQDRMKPDITTQLAVYIKKILLAEPKLSEIVEFSESSPISEQLSWILLYSLFDDINFENYYHYNKSSSTSHIESFPTKQSSKTSDSSSIQKKYNYINTISKKCRSSILYSKLSTYILLSITAVQMVCFVIPFSLFEYRSVTNQKFLLFCILMLIVAVFLFILRYIPYYFSRKAATYKIMLDNYEENPFSVFPTFEYHKLAPIHSHDIQRKENRKILLCILFSFWIVSILISLYLNSFPILCAGILISFALYLHCEHILNFIMNSKGYCRLFANPASPSKASVLTGLAMRFAWDYDNKSHLFLHKEISDHPNHSIACIRSIFYSHADRQEYLWTSYTIFSLLLNSIVLLISIIQFQLPFNSYFQFSKPEYFSIFCMVWIIVSDFVYITLLLQTDQHYNTFMKYINYSNNTALTDKFLKKAYQQEYYRGRIANIDISRGIFLYNCSKWEQNLSSISIYPIDDRELVIHRYYDKLERLTLSSIAFYLAYLCIIVWHFHIFSGLWSIPVVLITYPLFAFKLLPWLDQLFVKFCIKKYLLKQPFIPSSIKDHSDHEETI